MATAIEPTTIVPDPELQGYELPYHWFMPRDNVWTRIHNAYVASAVEHILDSKAHRVLEVGCGDGWNCHQLKKAGIEAVGVDWSTRGIGLARCLEPAATFVVGDLRDPAVRSELRPPFDALLMVEVIEHIPPDECPDALRTIREYLRPGGVLVLTTPSVNWPNTNPRHFRHFSPADIRSLAAEGGGYEVVSIEGYGDVNLTRRFQLTQKLVDNRFYRLKPVVHRLLDRVERKSRSTNLARAMGLVAVLRSVGD